MWTFFLWIIGTVQLLLMKRGSIYWIRVFTLHLASLLGDVNRNNMYNTKRSTARVEFVRHRSLAKDYSNFTEFQYPGYVGLVFAPLLAKHIFNQITVGSVWNNSIGLHSLAHILSSLNVFFVFDRTVTFIVSIPFRKLSQYIRVFMAAYHLLDLLWALDQGSSVREYWFSLATWWWSPKLLLPLPMCVDIISVDATCPFVGHPQL